MAAHPLQRPADMAQDFASVVFETTAALLVMLDREGRIIRFNPACERLSGYRRHEVEGTRLWDFLIPPERISAVRRRFFEVVADSDVRRDGDHLWLSKLGERIPVRWTDSTILDANGAVQYIVCTGIDLREQQATLRALEGSERRFRSAFDFAPTGMSITSSPDGDWLQVNRMLCTMLGYTEAELVTKSWAELTHPDHLETSQALALSMHRGEIDSFEIEKRYLHKDGHEVWALLIGSLVRDADGRPLCSIGQLQDITERKRAEVALQETSATLSAIFEASPAAIVTYDRAGNVTAWNTGAEGIFGWTSDEVLGRTPPYLDDVSREHFLRTLARALAGRTTLNERLRRRRRDGTTIELSGSAAPLRDARGRIIGMAGVLTDYTERKQLEDQLAQSQRLESIGRLAGGIAHDFNNILTAISGYTELLLVDLEGSDPRRAHAEEISRASERAGALVKKLLAFSRKQFLQPRVISLHEVVADLEPMLGRLIGEDIELVVAEPMGRSDVEADPVQVEQMIVNLVVNARDAMPQGGTIAIKTETVELADASARPLGLQAGPYVVLHVVDTGIGMDEETRAHIFEPFFTTKEPGKGTGLGLATAHGMATQSGGGIEVESRPGVGTAFSVYLPAVEREHEHGRAPCPGAAERSSRVRDGAARRRRGGRQKLRPSDSHGRRLSGARCCRRRRGPLDLRGAFRPDRPPAHRCRPPPHERPRARGSTLRAVSSHQDALRLWLPRRPGTPRKGSPSEARPTSASPSAVRPSDRQCAPLSSTTRNQKRSPHARSGLSLPSDRLPSVRRRSHGGCAGFPWARPDCPGSGARDASASRSFLGSVLSSAPSSRKPSRTTAS